MSRGRSMIRRLLVCVSLVGVLAAPAGASAFYGEGPMRDNPALRRAFTEAEEFWGRYVSEVCSTLHVETEPAWSMGKFLATTDAAFLGRAGNCRIEVRHWLAPCTRFYVLAHELGHLFGYEHVSDPSSIMQPKYDPELAAELCQERGI